MSYLKLHTALNIANQLPVGENNKTYTAVGNIKKEYDSLCSLNNLIEYLIEWLFTAKPGQFGLIPGWANPTGWGLLILVSIMAIFSLPFVRKSGNFEV